MACTPNMAGGGLQARVVLLIWQAHLIWQAGGSRLAWWVNARRLSIRRLRVRRLTARWLGAWRGDARWFSFHLSLRLSLQLASKLGSQRIGSQRIGSQRICVRRLAQFVDWRRTAGASTTLAMIARIAMIAVLTILEILAVLAIPTTALVSYHTPLATGGAFQVSTHCILAMLTTCMLAMLIRLLHSLPQTAPRMRDVLSALVRTVT